MGFMRQAIVLRPCSAPGDDLYDLHSCALVQKSLAKLRRRNCLAVKFDDNASRQQLLRYQELLQGTRQGRLNGFAICDDSDGI